ncbi:MAG: acyltransferase family protein [Verrucomicrobiaceae bacterium]|nr:acyltransferase family protein [Verrucomicrobiaceae bacterium]
MSGLGAKCFAIDILKAIAALLIINSHLEPLYPRAWMAADGMLGNTIFFFVAGWTLSGSLTRRPEEGLGTFMVDRLWRLYPTVWIVMVTLYLRDWSWTEPRTVVHSFLYPTAFGFVAAVVPLYPVLFLVKRYLSARAMLWLAMVFSVVAAVMIGKVYGRVDSGTKVVWSDLGTLGYFSHFLSAMLAGAVMEFRGNSKGGLGALLVLIGVYFSLRYGEATVGGHALQVGARMLLPVTLMVCLGLVLVLFRCVGSWQPGAWLSGGIGFLSAYSWETYLVHEGVRPWVQPLAVPWVAKILLLYLGTFAVIPFLKLATRWLERLVRPGNKQLKNA